MVDISSLAIPTSFIFKNNYLCETLSNADLKSINRVHSSLLFFPLSAIFYALVVSKNRRRFTSHPIPFLNPVYWLFSLYWLLVFSVCVIRLLRTLSKILYMGLVMVIGLQVLNLFRRSLFLGMYIWRNRFCLAGKGRLFFRI